MMELYNMSCHAVCNCIQKCFWRFVSLKQQGTPEAQKLVSFPQLWIFSLWLCHFWSKLKHLIYHFVTLQVHRYCSIFASNQNFYYLNVQAAIIKSPLTKISFQVCNNLFISIPQLPYGYFIWYLPSDLDWHNSHSRFATICSSQYLTLHR